MKEAINQARIAMQRGEVPVGAVVFDSLTKKIIAKAYNMIEELKNPLMHAEIIVLNEAIKIKNSKYLNDCCIYVTLEPCIMCMDAISKSRVGKLYYAASDNKKYSCNQYCRNKGIKNNQKFFSDKVFFSKTEIYNNIMEYESVSLLNNFFYGIRNDTEFNFN